MRFRAAPPLFALALLCSPSPEAAPDGAERGGSAASPGSPAAQLTRIAPAARPSASSMDLRLKLPFAEGESYEVYQGNNGTFSHSGLNRHAYDFGLPEGRQVVAAAEGRVVRVKQDSGAGGVSIRDFAHGNTVILDHGRGLFTQYLHLKKGSARVHEGQLVRAGQVLGLSGNTGYSSIPHLHFQVQDALGQSLPARFVDVPGDGVPRSGQFLVSGNDGRAVSRYAGESPLPTDAFAGNGITLDVADLPAHLLSTEKTYKLLGSSATPARKIAVYLMSPQGGRPVHTVYCEVGQDGRFAATLDLSQLPATAPWSKAPTQSNLFALAIAPVAEDGSFWSAFSVPITAR